MDGQKLKQKTVSPNGHTAGQTILSTKDSGFNAEKSFPYMFGISKRAILG
jgi:hypothetical protein